MEWEKLLCSDRIRGVKAKTNGNDLRTEFEKDYHRIPFRRGCGRGIIILRFGRCGVFRDDRGQLS